MDQQNYQASFTVKQRPESFRWYQPRVGLVDGQPGGQFGSIERCLHRTLWRTSATIKLIEVVPDRKIVWQVLDCYLHFLKDKTEWKDTTIVWEFHGMRKARKFK